MLDVHRYSEAAPQCPAPLEGHWAGVAIQTPMCLARAVLPGMVAQGHGIEALCSFLSLGRAALFDHLVDLDLPTPHDRPLRKVGGRHPWSVSDTVLFIVLWMAGWHAESLGQHFDRSARSAWAKARQLGLPRRDRKLIFRPANPGEELSDGVLQGHHPNPETLSRLQRDEAGAAPVRLTLGHWPQTSPVLARELPNTGTTAPLSYPASGTNDLFGPTPVGTPPRRKAKRQEIPWTRERDIELGQRWWARQHYKAIARDMGITPSAVQSRRFRLGLPSFRMCDLFIFRREELVDHFDPSVVAEHIAAAGYKERKCTGSLKDGRVFWFWTQRNHTSDEYARLGRKRANRPPPPPTGRPPTLCFASTPW